MPPDVEEQRNSPEAWREGEAAARAMHQDHLKDVVRVQKQEHEDARKELRRRWALWWELWDNRVDLSAKEEWQAQVWVPKPYTTVEQATALTQRALLDSPEFWGIEGRDTRDKALAAQVWKPVLSLLLDECHFGPKWLDAAKCGYITGVAGYLKFRWQTTAVPQQVGVGLDPQTGQLVPQFADRYRSFLAVDWVDPCKIYRDPESKPRENFSGTYLYHTEWKDRQALRAMQQSGWDPSAIEEVLEDSAGRTGSASYGMTDSDRRQYDEVGLKKQPHKYRRRYLVDEGWLDIPDENGDLVFPDALMVHSNGRIIYGPVKNPLWAVDLQTGRRKWPFIAGAPIANPTQFEGRGLLEEVQDLAWIYSHLFMLFLDGLNWVVNMPTEVQQDILVDWDDLAHYPGKLWVTKAAGPALRPAAVGKMDVGATLSALQYIEQILQNSSFVTDFAIGLPGARSDITKGEVQIKTAQSLAIFEAIGRNFEQMGRECVELSHNLTVQYADMGLLARVLGDPIRAQLAAVSPPERMQMLQGNFDFRFTGVSQALQKGDQLQRLAQFAQLAGSVPYIHLLAQRPQVFMEILTSMRDALGIGDKIHLPDMQPMGQPGAPPGAPPGVPGGLLPPEIQAMLGGAGPASAVPNPPSERGQVDLAAAQGVA
jgi:hypothetical protein